MQQPPSEIWSPTQQSPTLVAVPIPQTICMISDDFLPAMTGVGIHLKLIAPELVRRGYRVVVITTRRKGESAIEQWNGVTIYRVFTLRIYGFYQALPSKKRLREIFRHEKPNVVHHHYVGFMMARACQVARKMNLPQISTYHFGPEVLTQPLPMRPFRKLIRCQMVRYNNRFSMILSPSKNLAKQIAHEGVRTPIRYITNPVVFGEPQRVIQADRLPDFTVMYAGRLGPEKNIGYLFKAFAQLIKQTPTARLWIAGQGPERVHLERLAESLKVRPQIEFLGFLDHPTLARYYKACDVFVLPSLQEAQSLAVMEAMWFSRPVIVTKAIVSADELVDHGVNGYIVDPNSIEDLAEKLKTLASDPLLRKSFGEEGLRHSQSYRPETVVNELESAYRDVRLGQC